MLGTSRIIAFVATTDAARARAFYEGVLGLRLLADEPYALVFDAAGTTLRIAKVRELTPAPHTVLGWEAADIAAVADALAARGAAFERYPGFEQDARGVWTSPAGAKIAWFRDPDGNLLSLTEPPR